MDFKSKQNLKKHQMSKNQIAAAGAVKFLSATIIVAVVIYAEIMYLQIISTAFPDGVFRALASIGAVASGLSVLALVLGKMYWFPPGGQTIWAWCFTAMETLVLVLNLLLSFEIHWNNVDSYMATWRDFSPASPVIALIGWIVIWQLDSSTKARHAILEQEQSELESELDYRGQVHIAVMDLKHNYLAQTVENLKYEFSSPEVQGQLRQGARDLAAGVLSEFTNIPVAPRPPVRESLPAGNTVNADPGSGARPYETRQAAQQAQASQGAGAGAGFLGGLVDKAKGLFNGQGGDDQQEPPQAVQPAPTPTPVAEDWPPRRPVPQSRPEPSTVAERRRRRQERLRRQSQPEPQTEALPVTPEPVAVTSAPESEVIAPRAKKKLPKMRT